MNSILFEVMIWSFPHSHDFMFVHALFKSDKLAHAFYTSPHLVHTGNADW